MSPLLSSLVNCTMTWLLDNTMVPGCCDPQYFPFVDEKNRNRLFILVCFFWLNVKELESLTFLRKNRFFLSKLYLWDCFGFRHRLWLGHTCNFHCPLVRICPQTPILCAKVNELDSIFAPVFYVFNEQELTCTLTIFRQTHLPCQWERWFPIDNLSQYHSSKGNSNY